MRSREGREGNRPTPFFQFTRRRRMIYYRPFEASRTPVFASSRLRVNFLAALLLWLVSGFAGVAAATAQDSADLRMPEIVAHRGASFDAPENTMASIQLAWALDADAVEFDIFLTADDEIVLFHDQNTSRITGRDGVVEELTLAQLRELDYGAWKAPQWRGESIPTLRDALATLPEGKRFIVEAKSDVRIVEPMLEVFDEVPHHPHQFAVIAFSYDVAAETKRLRPRTPVYWLVGFEQDEQTGEWTPSMEDVVRQARAANLNGVNLSFVGPATDGEDVALIREAGLGFYVWTVDDVDDAQRALELGVDGLTTNRPAWMKTQLLSRNGWRLLSP
ncbi:MAG: glycerophosphodiester phosphodiesterase [Gemmatimonas sp.]|nr:glycerophosphodiester phosphodiesterase [Gemmatimonas sp.]